ncbi:MAG: hypothetical protein J5525_05180 [Lachnospiraceae bacterium]|nr:hypothetical protein [Lachnospiraceae bacterium]
MFDRIFANYLAECGKLSGQNLKDIFSIQDSKRVRLGVIAVSEKLMTIEQVEEVNQLQAVLDKRFGDIAIEKGYLNNEQVGRLLVLQGNSYLAFVQSVVDGGYLSMEEIENMLSQYQRENNFTLSNMEDLKSCDINRIMPIFLYNQPEMLRELASVITRTLVRIVDFHTFINKPSTISEYPYKAICSQVIGGDHRFLTAFSGDAQNSLMDIAVAFAGADNVDTKEDAVDALCELVNCVNGLYASDMSNRDVDIDMEAPIGTLEEGVLKADKILCIPAYVCGKQIDILLTMDQEHTM